MNIPLKQYFALLKKYLRPQWRRALLLAIVMGGSIVLQLWNPQNLRQFIDAATTGNAFHRLAGIAVLFIGIALAHRVMATLGRYMGENVGWTATNLLRADLTRHCLGLDMAFHKARTPGELIERLDGDVNLLSSFFSQFIIGVISNLVLLMGVLLVLFIEDWRVGLAMAAFAAIALVVLMHIRRIGVPHWTAARHASAGFYGFLGERLAGTEDVRSCGATGYVMGRFYETLRAWMPLNFKAKISHYRLWQGALLVFGVGTVLGLGSGALLYRAGRISIGTVFLIFNYTSLLERPLQQLRTQLQELQTAGAAIERIQGLFDTMPQIRDGSGRSMPEGPLGVQFDNVSFGYEDGDTVLGKISFQLNPGRVLGLLGRTGSGKTTLVRLLVRLYDPSAGTIHLGGVDSRDAHVAALRTRVGMVTQDVQLFNATLRDNLTFFDESLSDGRIWEALDAIGISDWCRRLPQGLDTHIGSGGMGVSAGEAQVLALGRLFLADPGLVILDEASSRLDPATEQLVDRAIRKLLEGRTGIIIAHRLATVEQVDDIMILEAGCILEHGPRHRLAVDPSSRFHSLLKTGMEDMLA